MRKWHSSDDALKLSKALAYADAFFILLIFIQEVMSYTLLFVLDNGIEIYVLNTSEYIRLYKRICFLKFSYKFLSLKPLG